MPFNPGSNLSIVSSTPILGLPLCFYAFVLHSSFINEFKREKKKSM